MNNKNVYVGNLELSDESQYILHQDDNKEVNISKLLDQIYYADSNGIEISIEQIFDKGSKTVYEDNGLLIMKKNLDGFYSFHIASVDVDLKLFNLVDERIEITINHLTDGRDMGYGQK